ncbi:MAG: PorP/SprF family type IX secretion system membrane protein [Bacteroidota bacterium]
MLKRFLIIAFLLTLNPKAIFGQQDPQFSQYYFNQQYYNPSVVSAESLPQIQVLHRSQYLGYVSNFDKGGTLNTQLLSFQMPLSKSKAGIGLVIINDQVGLEKNQQMRFSYAKNLKVSRGALSVGVSAGFYNKSYNSNFRPRENNDPNIPADGYSQIKPDFGLGVSYHAKYYFGAISINHINSPKFDFGADNGNNIINRNVTGIFGVNINVNQKLEIKPNVLLRSDLQTYTIEGGLLAEIGKKYWFGTNYRSQDAVILLAGASLMSNKALKLGVAYDLVAVQQNIKSASSFEIMASYLIGSKNVRAAKAPAKIPIIRTPRYRH